jgi:hypothetical protein
MLDEVSDCCSLRFSTSYYSMCHIMSNRRICAWKGGDIWLNRYLFEDKLVQELIIQNVYTSSKCIQSENSCLQGTNTLETRTYENSQQKSFLLRVSSCTYFNIYIYIYIYIYRAVYIYIYIYIYILHPWNHNFAKYADYNLEKFWKDIYIPLTR